MPTPHSIIPVYLYDENGHISGVKVIEDDVESTYYYQTNIQGDVIGILNEAGIQVAAYTYDEWGKVTSITGSDAKGIGALNPIRYRGYYYDTETGFYYLNSRYYDPEVGRFINSDSVISGIGGSVLGYNLFSYCGNNPINRYDRSGHFWDDVKNWINEAYNTAKDWVVDTYNDIVDCVNDVADAVTDFVDDVIDYFTPPSKNEHYNRNDNNLDFPTKYDREFFDEGWNDEVSANCHQFSAPNRDNKKYVSVDGKFEAIYSIDGTLVIDARDVGTYNYVSPVDDGLGHFIKDVVPWIMYGNSPDDSTNWWQRCKSFIGIYE